MEKQRCRKGKLNNAGMTLVEIIVAMAILGVVIVPLMYSFVYAAQFSAKGREMQQATTIAHTVMENCKAYSVEEIAEYMSDHSFMAGVTGWDKVEGIDSVAYYMTGVELDQQKYDVEVKLTPYEFYDPSGTYTTRDIMSTKNMNPVLDGVFMVQSTPSNDATPKYAVNLDVEAYETVLQKISDEIKNASVAHGGVVIELPLAEIEDSFKTGGTHAGALKLKRRMTIDAGNAAGYEEAKVTYSYAFELTTGKYNYEYIDEEGNTVTLEWECAGEQALNSAVFPIYSNQNTATNGAVLENIYVFYYPAYSTVSGLALYPFAEDNIVISNGLGRTINLYLMKQKNTAYENSELITLENTYAPAISGSGTINLHHNYYENIGNSASGVSVPTVSGVTLATPTAENADAPLFSEVDKQLMYDVVVTVYKANSYDDANNVIKSGSESIITLNGTILNW